MSREFIKDARDPLGRPPSHPTIHPPLFRPPEAANVGALTTNFRYYRIVISDTVISFRPRRERRGPPPPPPPRPLVLRSPTWLACLPACLPASLFASFLPRTTPRVKSSKLPRTAAGVLSVRLERDLREPRARARARPIVARETADPHYLLPTSPRGIRGYHKSRAQGYRTPPRRDDRLDDITIWITAYITMPAITRHNAHGTGGLRASN